MTTQPPGTRAFGCLAGRRCALWGVLLVLLCARPAPLAAQGNAEIRGVVTDQQGSLMTGVSLTLRNQETGVTRVSSTDADGQYRFLALSPGRYAVRAEQPSFQSVEVQDLVLTIGFLLIQDFSLKVASVAEAVTVTAETRLVESTNTEISSVISKEQISQLPINSRSYLSLALLAPGVSPDVNRGFFESVQVGGGSTFNSTRNIVDGVTNNWIEDGEPRQDIPEDAVSEFKISNAQFKPEFGMATAGVVQIVTKSGTNQLHGTAYEYFRTKALNAQGVFETEKPEFRRHQYGGSLGGPIVKDKMHFFGAVERTNITQFYTVTTGLPQFYSSVEGTFTQPSNRYIYMGRYDWQINNSQSLFVTANWENQTEICGGCGGSTATAGGTDWFIPRRAFTAGHTWTPSPRRLNDFRFEVAWGSYYFMSPSGAPFWTRAEDFSPERFRGRTLQYNFPSLTWGNSFDEMAPERRWEFRDAYSIAFAKHNLKLGGEYNYNPYQYASAGTPLGSYTFGTDQYFNPNDPKSIANLKDATTFSASVGDLSVPHNTTYYAGFIQDDWKIRPNLTLYLGLRYEREINCCNEKLDVRKFPRPIPFIDVSKRGDPNNFAPRFGLAWDPTGNGRSVVKAGYGVYYGHVRIYRHTFETANLQKFAILITNPSYPDPYGGRSPREFVAGGPPPIWVTDNNYVQPYAQQYSAGFERQLSRQFAVSVDGVYNLTLKEQKMRDINARDPVTRLRPLPEWDRIDFIESSGFVKYRALYAKLEKRYSSRYQFLVSYTLSKVDDNNPLNFYIDPFDKSVDIGPGRFDRRHALVASGSIILPGSVVVGIIGQYRSQLPWSAAAGRDLNQDGRGGDLVPGTTRDSGSRDLNINAVNAYRAANRLSPVNASQFDSSRLKVVDLRVAKWFPIKETRRFEAMFQVFNLFNTKNLGGLQGSGRVGNALSASFGQINVAKPKIQAEVALKFVF